MTEIALHSPSGLVQSPAFSHVAVIPPGATTILVGGQNGVDESGTIVSDEPAAQVTRALDNVETALAEAGATFDDVVAWTILFAEAIDVQAAYAVAGPRLARDGAPPLVTAAIVSGLAVPGALIELSVTAAVVR
ncbi:RidA family protein [Mumia sp. Pv 4-285]|uniref:RidA family protein n=1 Tax=Mumia qirimensis TaxID=3234852 RepID=UPI00351D57A4